MVFVMKLEYQRTPTTPEEPMASRCALGKRECDTFGLNIWRATWDMGQNYVKMRTVTQETKDK